MLALGHVIFGDYLTTVKTVKHSHLAFASSYITYSRLPVNVRLFDGTSVARWEHSLLNAVLKSYSPDLA